MTTAVDKLVQGYCSYRDGSYEDSRPLIEDLVERGQHPEVAARLGTRLNSLLPPDLDRRRLAVLPRDAIDEATLERLRSLGYIR